MDIRNYFGSINKSTGKPEKRKIESKSSEEEPPTPKRKQIKVVSPDESKKKSKKKIDEKKPKKSFTIEDSEDDDDFDSLPTMKKRTKIRAVVLDSDEDEVLMKKSKKVSNTMDSDSDEGPTVTKKRSPNDENKNSKQHQMKKELVPKPMQSPSVKKSSPVKAKVPTSPKASAPWVYVPRDAIPKLPKSEMWVDKYKPVSVKQVIGQQGDRSCANKLLKWLSNWFRNKDVKPAFGKFGNGNDDGAGFKAALLSGPPGIGKTTTAHLCAKECKFEFVEFNASDTRNKKSMEEHVRTLLTNRALTSTFASGGAQSTTAKHLIIMDEVDGMGGNADRGGVAELIQLIKQTKIPVICICNDRNNPKIRSLANYCFDLRFMRPRVEQIKGAMMSVLYKENVKIDPQTLTQIIESSNHDVRQVLHYLSLYTSKEVKMSKMSSSDPIKDVKLGPFDACKRMFTAGPEYEAMSFHDKTDLFFSDYSLMPLFAYDNYIRCNPVKAKSEVEKLRAATRAINSISFGDTIEAEIRQKQNWSLLPLQAAFATVMPGFYVNGYFTGQISFPALLGKISNLNKRERLLSELKQHMNLKVSGSKVALNLDYLFPLRDRLLKPLLSKEKDAVERTISVLHDYNLRKDDIESILEFTLWGSEKNPFTLIDSKTKAALTRSYNKIGEFLPYATEDMFKKAKVKGAKAEKTSKSKKDVSDDEELDDIDDEDVIPDDF